MKRWPFFAVSGGLVAAAGIFWYLMYRRQQMELPVNVPEVPQGTPTGGRVQNRERARGALPPLQAFLDWWDRNGPFSILVAPDGGLRTDAAKQAMYYAQGNSKAKTLAQTPHGRGAALDLWPVGFNPSKDLKLQPDIKAKFEEMGAIAKGQFDLTWGGDWGWDFPHVEIKSWSKLPYPPTGGFAGFGISPLTAFLLPVIPP